MWPHYLSSITAQDVDIDRHGSGLLAFCHCLHAVAGSRNILGFAVSEFISNDVKYDCIPPSLNIICDSENALHAECDTSCKEGFPALRDLSSADRQLAQVVPASDQ